MTRFKINDTELEVEDGTTILKAALGAGIKIPYLCFNKELEPYGACRVCLVELVKGGRAGIHASCTLVATEGMEVLTNSERVQKTRRVMFELLLSRAPDSEKIKKLALEYGVSEPRVKIRCEENCILCGLCVRACEEIPQRSAISFSGRGIEKKVETPFDKVSDRCIGCGTCAYVCPTKTIKIEEA